MIQEVGDGTGSGFVLDTPGHDPDQQPRGRRRHRRGTDRASSSPTAGVPRPSLVGRSPSYDLAVIKVKASQDLRRCQTRRLGAAAVGEPVVAIGSPFGLPGTVTQGIVCAQ